MAGTWKANQYSSAWGVAFFHGVLRLFGKAPAYFCLHFVILAYVVCFPSIRKNCRPYLTRRFPGTGPLGALIHCYRQVLTFGQVLMDNAAMAILGPASIRADFRDPADDEKLKGLETGFIILMSHVGCWQVAISALSRLNRRVNLLMLSQDGRMKEFGAGQAGSRLRIINPDQFLGGTLEMLDVLKKDEILCIMGDRLFGNSAYALAMDFLGDRADFPFSAYKLAGAARRPVVVLNTVKTGRDTYKLEIPAVIHVPPGTGKKGENYRPFARRYVETLERYTRENPYQFFNFFDMWAEDCSGVSKAPPGGRP